MSNEPSFYSLYRRSRYARGEDDDHVSDSSRQNRKELYAVAAVAFALKYDPQFREHFLGTVCGIPVTTDPFAIFELQPFHHTDFAIKEGADRWLSVVEFKVDDKLKQKQNPGSKEFFAEGGYGQRILSEPAYQNFERKIYVVIDEGGTFADGTEKGLEYKSRSWADLNPPTGVATEMWSDLLRSLGELGVSAFQLTKLRNMNNATYTQQAVAMHQTLSALASKLKFGTSGSMEINMEGEEAWYGRNVPLDRMNNHIFLRALAGVDSSGWFGYQAGPSHWELAIWIYCESEAAAPNLRNHMQALLTNGPSGKLEVNGKDVSFVSDMHPQPGDSEWFEAAFRALDDKNRPK
ncbi:MAG TPA: hypothetical protein VII34_01660 [Pyrinomonadaceae bacterium]